MTVAGTAPVVSIPVFAVEPTTISARAGEAAGITVDPLGVELKAGQSAEVKIALTPSDSTSEVTFSCPNTNVTTIWNSVSKVLTISIKDNATSKNGFNTTITASAGSATATIAIAVLPTVRSITVTPTSLDMETGDSQVITVKKTPTGANDPINYKSQNEAVASVDSDGVVTALTAGKTNIVVTCGSITQTIPVSVIVGLKALQFDTESLVMEIGDTSTHAAVKVPSNAEGTIRYRSGNTNIASVDSTGKITAIGRGTTKVTATCGTITATINVTVNPPVTDIIVDPTRATIVEGKTQQFTATKLPADATAPISYTIADTEYATVDTTGMVTAIKPGKTKLTVTAGGISKNFDILVVSALEDIEVTPSILALEKGEKLQLTSRKVPEFATGEISYSSMNPGVITVSDTGELEAVEIGVTTVVVYSGSIQKRIIATVYPPLEDISFIPEKVYTSIGKQVQITANKVPYLANGSIKYESADPSIATVDGNGLVTGISDGDTTVTISCGVISKTVPVNVGKELKDLLITPNPVILPLSGTTKLDVAKQPADALGAPIFTSNDTGVVTVDTDGNITPVAVGETTITVTVGAVTKDVPVKITPVLDGIVVTPEKADLVVGDTEQITVKGEPEEAVTNPVYTSSNPDIVEVTPDGLISAKTPGDATITVTCGSIEKEIPIKVTPVLTDFSVSPTTVKVNVGGTQQLDVTNQPTGALGNASFTSGNDGIASVSHTGLITGVGKGSTVINVTVGGLTKQVNVDVVPELTNFTATCDKDELDVGDTGKITVEKQPADAEGEPTFESNNPAVLSVDDKGVVTAVGKGDAEVTIRIGSVEKKIPISVYPLLTDIRVAPDELNLEEGAKETLQVIKVPEDARGTASFKSNDPSIATVTSSGVVTAVKPGTTTVIVSVNGIEEAILVRVSEKVVPELNIPNGDITVRVDDTKSIGATTKPEANPGEITYESSDEGVATVSPTGVITGVGEGTAVITIKYKDIIKTINVTVDSGKVLPEGIEVDDDFSVTVDETEKIKPVVIPSDTTNKGLTFESEDPTIAIVDDAGNITGVKPGTTTIVITSKEDPTITKEVTVTVHDKLSLTLSSNTEYSKDHTAITADATGDIKYLILPNGNQVSSNNFTYNVIDNGTYTFVAVSNDGKRISKSITVNSIDKTPPTLIINSEITSTETTYSIDGLDSESGIDYAVLPGGKHETVLPASYVQNMSGSLTFAITDKAGNITTQTVQRMDSAMLGIGSTVIGYEGIPEQWTNQDVTLKGFAVNTAVGAAIGLNKTPPDVLSTDKVEDSITVKENTTVNMTVKDGDGNVKNIPLVVDKIDKDNPEAEITQETGKISVVASDGLSGVKQILLPDGNLVTGIENAEYTPKFNGTYEIKVEDNAGNIATFAVDVDDLRDPDEAIKPPTTETDGTDDSVIDINGKILPIASDPSSMIKVVIPTRMDFVIDEERNFISGDYTFENTGDKDVTLRIIEVTPTGGTITELVAPETYSDWSTLTESQTKSSMALLLGGISLHQKNVDLIHLQSGKTMKLPLTAKHGKKWGNSENITVNYSMTLEIVAD